MSKIADKIIDNLVGRSGFDGWWSNLDDAIQTEIKEEIQKEIPLGWVKFSDSEPKKGEYVDIYSNARYREADFEYEGEGVFYENNNDETRKVNFSETETIYNITHWMRIPDCS